MVISLIQPLTGVPLLNRVSEPLQVTSVVHGAFRLLGKHVLLLLAQAVSRPLNGPLYLEEVKMSLNYRCEYDSLTQQERNVVIAGLTLKPDVACTVVVCLGIMLSLRFRWANHGV